MDPLKNNKRKTVKTLVNEHVEKVWECWTKPEHITKWNQASDDWQTTFAENDLTAGGEFLYRMEAMDKREGFDFTGMYTEVKPLQSIAYTLDDGRKVTVAFESINEQTTITETFETENTYPVEQQKEGWQSILDHFKKYTEGISQP